jgi:hypothetical protein
VAGGETLEGSFRPESAVVAAALAAEDDKVKGCRPAEKTLEPEGREEEDDLREPVCKGDVADLGEG